MDSNNCVVLVEFSGKQVPEFQVFYVFPERVNLVLDLLEEQVPPFFKQDADGFFYIEELLFELGKRGDDIFEPCLFLEQFP